jgi:hypothetical protein
LNKIEGKTKHLNGEKDVKLNILATPMFKSQKCQKKEFLNPSPAKITRLSLNLEIFQI